MGKRPRQRVTVRIEAVVEITDARALQKAAMADIDRTQFTEDPNDPQAEQERAAARREMDGDPIAAVSWLVDDAGLLDDVPGVQVVHTSVETIGGNGQESRELADDGVGEAPDGRGPQFVELFGTCRCG